MRCALSRASPRCGRCASTCHGCRGTWRASAEPKLAGYSNACGCAAGAAAMLAVCASLVAWLIFSYGLSAGFFWRLPIAFLGGLIAAGIGKWLGLAYARSRLGREIEKLLSLQPHPTEV